MARTIQSKGGFTVLDGTGKNIETNKNILWTVSVNQKVDLLEAEIRSFLQSVRNRTHPRVSGLDGRRTLELALQVIQRIHDLNKRKERRGD